MLEGLKRQVDEVEGSTKTPTSSKDRRKTNDREKNGGLVNEGFSDDRSIDAKGEERNREGVEELRGKIQRLETEVRSQDVILRGYQVEAERMYQELKVSRVKEADDGEGAVERLLHENSTLKSQIIKLK